MQTTIGTTTLRLVTGDIAEQDANAVVTAAHWRLNKPAVYGGLNANRPQPLCPLYRPSRYLERMRRLVKRQGTVFRLGPPRDICGSLHSLAG